LDGKRGLRGGGLFVPVMFTGLTGSMTAVTRLRETDSVVRMEKRGAIVSDGMWLVIVRKMEYQLIF
jgi:hypothetical protein